MAMKVRPAGLAKYELYDIKILLFVFIFSMEYALACHGYGKPKPPRNALKRTARPHPLYRFIGL
jgi:hypothetical protein